MTDTSSNDNWVHFTADGHRHKRKRADRVCFYCHSKKIKCDLQEKYDRGLEKCSNCDTSQRDCYVRPSRRLKQVPGVPGAVEVTNAPSPGAVSQVDPVRLPRHRESTHHGSLPTSMQIVARSASTPMSAAPAERSDMQLFSEIAVNHSPFAPLQQPALTSPAADVGRSHVGDVDTGYLQIYGPEDKLDAGQHELKATLELARNFANTEYHDLQHTFAETYWEYLYCWCPVLDRDTLMTEMFSSPLLANSVALAASHVQPPLVPHEGTAAYYDKARNLFYNDEESDILTQLKAVCLFYWWAPRPPSTAHRHSSWWWTSVVIRSAQQMGIHREPAENSPFQDRLNLNLRRRIWWTAFARERLTALCQSKPCIIDPDDCNIRKMQPFDFPSDPESQRKGLIFIHWVRLCDIIGRVAKRLSRSTAVDSPPLRTDLFTELVEWVTSLPPSLQLQIGTARTQAFDRDVHQLYLPYLTTIIILHLKRSAHDLPYALPPAILAASCISRILRDILSRGNARFLMAITCWYSGTAFIALLQAARIPQIAKEAEDGITVLIRTIEELQKMWASANVIRQGFERLRTTCTPDTSVSADVHQSGVSRRSETSGFPPNPAQSSHNAHMTTLDARHGYLQHITDTDDFEWPALFPFVTRNTNRIAECLLKDKEHGTITRGMPSPNDMSFYETMLHDYQNIVEPFGDWGLNNFSDLNFEV